MSEPRFLVPGCLELSADARVIRLPDVEAHHASRVLRLGPGAAVRVFDGAGREWRGHVRDVRARHVEITLTGPVPATSEPVVHVTVAIGLLKGDQMDTVVRETTALGVSAIVPVISARVVAPARARVAAAHARWRRVAVQAAKQCGRAVVPALGDPVAFEDLLGDNSFDARMMLAEPQAGGSVSDEPPPAPGTAGPGTAGADRPRVLVLVGPEGGWTAEEVRSAADRAVPLWRLGPRTLRAELAPTVALAALWARWGW